MIDDAEYLRIIQNNVSEEEKVRVFQNLEKYCERDTLAMVWIMEELQKIINS